jgi:hypothetical protein
MNHNTGYWAWLLRKRGADVLAYDELPPGPNSGNHYHEENPCWIQVQRGKPNALKEHADRALMLCWPPYNEPMAWQSLCKYRGRHVVFIGEGQGGCTGDERFFKKLDREFREVAEVEIPQYEGLHDYLTIYERKK